MLRSHLLQSNLKHKYAELFHKSAQRHTYFYFDTENYNYLFFLLRTYNLQQWFDCLMNCSMKKWLVYQGSCMKMTKRQPHHLCLMLPLIFLMLYVDVIFSNNKSNSYFLSFKTQIHRNLHHIYFLSMSLHSTGR